MKELILFFCLSAITNMCFSQSEISTKLILTEKQNKDWFTTFESANKETKLILLKERIDLDTNVVFQKLYPDAYLLRDRDYLREKPPVGKYVGNRILLLINDYVFSEKVYEPKLILYLQEVKNLINNISIDEITVIQHAGAAAIYGRMGSGGVISLTTSDKKSEKLVKKLSQKIKKFKNKI